MSDESLEFLEPKQLLDILRIARADSQRNHLMILLAYKKGLRASEVCNILLSDIADGDLTVARLKNSKTTKQPLTKQRGEPLLDELRALKEYLPVRIADGGDVLFPSQKGGPMHRTQFFRIFQNYAAQAGLPKAAQHPHILKHSICSHLCQNNLGIEQVQAHVGHRAISSTGVYVKMNQRKVSEKVQNTLLSVF